MLTLEPAPELTLNKTHRRTLWSRERGMGRTRDPGPSAASVFQRSGAPHFRCANTAPWDCNPLIAQGTLHQGKPLPSGRAH